MFLKKWYEGRESKQLGERLLWLVGPSLAP